MIGRWSWHDRQFCPDDARWRIREACEILSCFEYCTFYDTMIRLDKPKDLCRPSAPDHAGRAKYVAQETALLVRELKPHIEAYRVRSPSARLGAWILGWIRPEVVDVENGVVLRPTRRCMASDALTRLWIRRDQRRRRRGREHGRSIPHNP